MKVTFLGTCAGTEPMPGRRHVSFVVEEADGAYWFDVGAGCAHTSRLGGIDLMAVRAIFVSHMHIDHIGGLPNLLAAMHKVAARRAAAGRPGLAGKSVDIRIPRVSDWQPVRDFMELSPHLREFPFELRVSGMSDGEVFRDPHVRVVALHNAHMGEPAPGELWPSYSLRIEAASGVIVYTGDVRNVAEIDPILDPCDLVLIETGHHAVDAVCDFLSSTKASIRRVGFIHHGRAILADPELPARVFRERSMPEPLLTEDGMTLEI